MQHPILKSRGETGPRLQHLITIWRAAGSYNMAPGTTYVGGVHSDDLQVEWDQVATCIKDNSWKAIYAKTDAEFDQIVADMTKQAQGYMATSIA